MKIMQFFKEKYKIMTYHKLCNVKAEHNYAYVSPCKISTKSAVTKLLLQNDIHFILQFFLSRMMSIGWRLIVLDPGGDDSSFVGGSDLGAAQNSQEVWTCTGQGWKGEPLEPNGLDAAHMTHWLSFESEKELLFIFMKIAWDNDHPGGWSLWKITWD